MLLYFKLFLVILPYVIIGYITSYSKLFYFMIYVSLKLNNLE